MAYQATIIQVMIASPCDVSDERKIVREVIYDWNDVNAVASKTMLSPVGWDTHSSPELGARPQELINSRVLKDCDLLVGVFWTRLGTPTGKSESGTVEEIEGHIKSGKPAMIYFSSKPIVPESIDSEQNSSVQSFKEKCKGHGIVEQFDNTTKFKSKFSKQLQITLTNNGYIKSLVEQAEDNVVYLSREMQQTENGYSLTEEAITLLKVVAQKGDGAIMKIASLEGLTIQTGDQEFGSGSSRESAKWVSALNELVSNDLVEEVGHQGILFKLTHPGWMLADKC